MGKGGEKTSDAATPQGMPNTKRALLQYRNGQAEKPRVDDLIVFAPTLLNRYGHVAIVAAVGEALLFASKAGADPAKVRQALMGGFVSSRILEVHGERMIKRSFAPGFRISLHQKDLNLALQSARSLGVALPQPRQVRGEAGLHVIARFGRSGRGAAREQEQQWRPWHHPAEAAQSLGTMRGSVLVITSVPNAPAPSSWAAYTALESPMCCIAAAPAVFGWKTSVHTQ